jgi:hypothetical protein
MSNLVLAREHVVARCLPFATSLVLREELFALLSPSRSTAHFIITGGVMAARKKAAKKGAKKAAKKSTRRKAATKKAAPRKKAAKRKK